MPLDGDVNIRICKYYAIMQKLQQELPVAVFVCIVFGSINVQRHVLVGRRNMVITWGVFDKR